MRSDGSAPLHGMLDFTWDDLRHLATRPSPRAGDALGGPKARLRGAGKSGLATHYWLMSLWKRLFGKAKAGLESLPLRQIPDGVMASVVTLSCDPHAADPERRFAVGQWGLRVADDETSQRIARGVLKRSAGKTLKLEPHKEVGHRGVISSLRKPEEGAGYSWIFVDADLRRGLIRFSEGDPSAFAGSGD